MEHYAYLIIIIFSLHILLLFLSKYKQQYTYEYFMTTIKIPVDQLQYFFDQTFLKFKMNNYNRICSCNSLIPCEQIK